jgi:hypothetical protein
MSTDTETTKFVRAQRVSLNRLPDAVDRNSARDVLEFVTCSSYPTARDPLLAVAHAAAQIILAMHDELHAVSDVQRENRDLLSRLEAAEREIAGIRYAISAPDGRATADSLMDFLGKVNGEWRGLVEAAEKRAEETERENRKLRSEAADAELRGLAAEMRKVRELVQSSNSYVPQDVAAECLLMLESVGLDKAGHGNTLLSMVTSAVERIADLQSRELTDAEENWPLRDVLSRLADFADDRLTRKDYDGHGHESLRICVDRARTILSARGSR